MNQKECVHFVYIAKTFHYIVIVTYLSGCLTFCIQTHARPSSSHLDPKPILPIDVALAGKEIQPQVYLFKLLQMKSPKPWA